MLGRGDGQLERTRYILSAQPADSRILRDEAEVIEGPAILEQKTLRIEKRMCVQGDGHKGHANQTD